MNVTCEYRYFVITRPFQYAMKRTPVRMMFVDVCLMDGWMDE